MAFTLEESIFYFIAIVLGFVFMPFPRISKISVKAKISTKKIIQSTSIVSMSFIVKISLIIIGIGLVSLSIPLLYSSYLRIVGRNQYSVETLIIVLACIICSSALFDRKTRKYNDR